MKMNYRDMNDGSIVKAEQWNPFIDGHCYVPMPPINSFLLVEKRSKWRAFFGKPLQWFFQESSVRETLIEPSSWCIFIASKDGDLRKAIWHVVDNDTFLQEFEKVEE